MGFRSRPCTRGNTIRRGEVIISLRTSKKEETEAETFSMESIRESELEEASIHFQIQHRDPQKRPTQFGKNGRCISQNTRRKSLEEKEAMMNGEDLMR
jgi:hypothetical protein